MNSCMYVRKHWRSLGILMYLYTSVGLSGFSCGLYFGSRCLSQWIRCCAAQWQEDGLVQPIAYANRSLQEHEKWYGVTVLERLGVICAVKHFRTYLMDISMIFMWKVRSFLQSTTYILQWTYTNIGLVAYLYMCIDLHTYMHFIWTYLSHMRFCICTHLHKYVNCG